MLNLCFQDGDVFSDGEDEEAQMSQDIGPSLMHFTNHKYTNCVYFGLTFILSFNTLIFTVETKPLMKGGREGCKAQPAILKSIHKIGEYSEYSNKLLHVSSFIICTEFCERLAFYGFQGIVLQQNHRVPHQRWAEGTCSHFLPWKPTILPLNTIIR